MTTDDRYLDLIKKDRDLKEAQKTLNKEISEFLAQETGINGEATIIDIIFAVKKKYDQKLVITP